MSKPTKFVGLHGHTQRSMFDGFGSADEHLQFAIDNGMDAMAITDHGNMCAFPEAEQKARDFKNKGINFKYIPGVEAYYHPDLKEWARDKATSDTKRKEERETAKKQPKHDEDDDPGVAVEDEESSKKMEKFLDPVKRRHHLVLLPKSRKGLENIFRLVSRSGREGYYRFPRVDAAMLKEHGEDIIVSTACISGSAIIQTNYGLITLKKVIDYLNKSLEIKVLSYDEKQNKILWKDVTAGQLTKKEAKVIRIKSKSGKILTLTHDHKVLTNEGWIEAGKLIIGHHKILTL